MEAPTLTTRKIETVSPSERKEICDGLRYGIEGDFALGTRSASQICKWARIAAKQLFHVIGVGAVVQRMTDEALEAQLKLQATWPATTDCDRLESAFTELDGSGILARHEYAFAPGDGHQFIGEEIAFLRSTRNEIRGYVFYDDQTLMNVHDNHGLHLSYGRASEIHELAIGHQIRECLRRHGLSSRHPFKGCSTILVSLKWQRRYKPDGSVTPLRPKGVPGIVRYYVGN
jgi:hypothetical protein